MCSSDLFPSHDSSGHSESGSQAGTNVQQVNDWLKQAYAYQGQEAAMQGKYNSQSMLKQMGYNTLQAIMQGVYNHIENSVAMNYNSAEALANREWQEHMSSTAYQRAVEDMRKAGLNPILAFANGGASTPGGSAGTISGASMGLASSSALGVSRSGGFVPNAYSSSSWSQSDWYNAAQSWQQMLSETHMTPYGLQKALTDSAMESIRFLNKNNGDIAIGIDKTKYERSEAWDIDVPGDYFLVDVKTGTRSNLLTKGKLLSISPSGNFALWYNHDEKQYVLANTKNGQKTNPLPNFAFSLTDEDNDIPAAAKPYGITGWTPNDEYVLINDRYDIWCIDLKAKKPAINLTNGRKNKIQFSYIKTNYDEVFIPTNIAILLKSVNEKDFSEALHTLTIQQKSDPQVLTSENCSISDIIKARNTNDFLWSKQTVERYPEILYSKSDFKNPVQLSVTNPQQKEFNWATVEMTSWLSFDGDSLRGLLYKPTLS